MVEVPKVADISNIKGISGLLALPLLCVAYILQTNASIGWDGNIWFTINTDLPADIQLRRLILIFVLKSLWVSGIAAFLLKLISVLHLNIDFPFLLIISIILLAIALFGIFGSEMFPQLKQINHFWFYCFIAWGVFLQSFQEKLDKPIPLPTSGSRKKTPTVYDH